VAGGLGRTGADALEGPPHRAGARWEHSLTTEERSTPAVFVTASRCASRHRPKPAT